MGATGSSWASPNTAGPHWHSRCQRPRLVHHSCSAWSHFPHLRFRGPRARDSGSHPRPGSSPDPTFWSEVARVPRLLLECLQAFLLTRESAGPRDPALPWGQVHSAQRPGVCTAWPAWSPWPLWALELSAGPPGLSPCQPVQQRTGQPSGPRTPWPGQVGPVFRTRGF